MFDRRRRLIKWNSMGVVGGGAAVPSSILTGLVAYWKLDEASDGSAPVQRNDSAGTNHLSDANQCLSAVGILSNGLVIAPGKEISIADNAELSLGNGVSCEWWGWVKVTTQLAQYQEMYTIKKSGASEEYNILLYRPGASTDTWIYFYPRYADNSGGGNIKCTTYGAIPLNTFVFLDVYHNADTNEIGIAINNGAFDTAAYTKDIRNSDNAFTLGGGSAGAGRAILDEVGFVKGRVLTIAERADLYNLGLAKTHPF